MKFTLRRLLSLFFILIVGIAWWLYFYYFQIRQKGIFIYPEKKEFFRYEFVKIFAEIKGYKNIVDRKTNTLPLKIFVAYNNQPVQTIGRKKIFNFKYDGKNKKWFVNFPCPWNPPLGKYKIIPVLDQNLREKKIPIFVEDFIIKGRPLPEMPSGFGVLTLEGISPLKSLKVRAPGGEIKGWQGLIDWTEFIGADAFWCLGGSTTYYKKKLPDDFPFVDYNFDLFGEVARECHRRGLKFGVYALGYMTFGDESTNIRKYLYFYAIYSITQNFGLGMGLNNSSLYFDTINDPRLGHIINPHSYLFEILINGGVFIFTLFFLINIFFLYSFLKNGYRLLIFAFVFYHLILFNSSSSIFLWYHYIFYVSLLTFQYYKKYIQIKEL